MKNISRRSFLKGSMAAAVGVGMMGMGMASAEGAPEITWDKETDVVVLGLGGAGASAAIEAYDGGAQVIVVEKQPEGRVFNNTRMSGGYFHNPDPTGDRAARVEYIKAMMSGENCPWKFEGEQEHVSQDMAEMFADGIMEVADFLKAQAPELDEEDMVPGGDASFPSFPSFAEAKYGHTVHCRYKGFADADPEKKPYEQEMMHKTNGEAFWWALVQEGIVEKRPEIEIMYDAPAQKLIQDETGMVIGVVVAQGDQTINIKAKKGVVLATGGFEFNLEMRRAFLEGPGVKGWSFYGSPYNTGDGIRIGIQAGAALAKVGKCASRIELAFPAGEAWEKYGLKQGVASAVTAARNSFIVDNFGKRYADESIITDSSRPYRYQFYHEAVAYDLLNMAFSRDPSWLIFDETLRSSTSIAVTGYSAVPFDFIPWTTDNMYAIEQGWILKADTIEELGEKIKADEENRNMMDPATLKATCDRFNELVAKGEDEDFGRGARSMGAVETGPFYAVKMYPGGPNTKGGVDADATRHVLDWEGNQIPRLYTAGEISSVYKFTYQAGGNLTECVVCGRLAGKNAAAEESWC